MTFMVAWVRDAGGTVLEQALLWVAIGVAAAGSPWMWACVLGSPPPCCSAATD